MKPAGVLLVAWAATMEEKAVVERNETWSLCEGLGRIRWGDDLTAIRRLYPEAYEKRRRFGRNPRTGEVIEVIPGLVVPRFLAVSDELFLDASVEFSLERVVEVLAIGPEFPKGELDLETRERDTDRMVRFLGEKLGLRPFEVDAMEQQWEVCGATVLLFREAPDEFMLSVSVEPKASGSEDARR
jgi:hypothetical protein